MSGQCYGCGTGYSFMKKEHSCKNCGFSFCGKCLPHKLEVPKLNYEKHSVCKKCHDFLTGKAKPEENSGRISPPEAYKRRIATLNEKIAKMNVKHLSIDDDSEVSKPSVRPPKLKPKYRGLSQEDMEIAERLERLRDRPGQTAPGVTEDDIRRRLANLRDEKPPDQASTSSKPFYQPPNRKTEQEQTDDLLDEILDEINIEAQAPDPVKDVEARLSNLKDDRVPPVGSSAEKYIDNNLNKLSPTNKSFTKNIEVGSSSTGDNISFDDMNKLIQQSAKELEIDAEKAIADLQKDNEVMAKLNELKKRKSEKEKSAEKSKESDSDNEDEDEEAKRIVKQFLEEGALDEASGIGDGKNSGYTQKKMELEPEDDDDDLPWCVMCNADATTRCHGCDGDLYCSRCFRESHDELEMTDHKTSKFILKKQRAES